MLEFSSIDNGGLWIKMCVVDKEHGIVRQYQLDTVGTVPNRVEFQFA